MKTKDKIKRVGLMHLDTTRVKTDLIETFKITNYCYDIIPEIFFEFDNAG